MGLTRYATIVYSLKYSILVYMSTCTVLYTMCEVHVNSVLEKCAVRSYLLAVRYYFVEKPEKGSGSCYRFSFEEKTNL